MKALWPRLRLVFLDLLATSLAVVLAFGLRFDWDIPREYLQVYLHVLPLLLPVRFLLYYLFRLYRPLWSHASVPELLRVFWAVSVDTAVFAVVVNLLPHGFPRSILVMGWFLQVAAVTSIRLAVRLHYHWQQPARPPQVTNGHKTLIYGAGDAGAMLAREFNKHPQMEASLVGFLDDDLRKQGYHVAGKPVLGARDAMADLVRHQGVTQVIIALPSAPSMVIREIVTHARSMGLRLKTLPSLLELVDGHVSIGSVRDVQIEDVLGRAEVKVDLGSISAYVNDQKVLLTGAGGSIGSELCRQIARFSPRELILLGHGENSIYEIDMELRGSHPGLRIIPVIADIQDESRIMQIFQQYRPGVVFHAAAHKHVPLMEGNPSEAIKNNVFGTWNVAQAAHACKAKRFVLISSDKAVNPTSVMGATKRAAEYVVQSLAASSETVFVAVRFGNVLGSRGSVVPLFKRQIAAGGPVTITDERMIRYFMTIPEAVQLVIQAGSMGQGGEIFVLNMGEPVRMVDLARDLIRLSGLEPDVDIPIVFTGIREGEKLYEELLTAEEGTHATEHQRIFVARTHPVCPSDVVELVEGLRHMVVTMGASNESVREFVRTFAEQQMSGQAGDD